MNMPAEFNPNDHIEDTYEYRPLIEQIPEEWRGRIEELSERFRKLYTALVYDSMEAMGMSGRSLKPGIGPIEPDIDHPAHKVAGPAFTTRRCTTPDTNPAVHNIRLGQIKSMCQGCIYVSDVQGNVNCGQFGEITATTMRAYGGCAGAVIDGSTRDSDYLIKMGFPTFVRWRSPVEGYGRSMTVEYMVPIYVNGVDGMLRIDPGDYIFGDGDGVVVIPKDKVLAVLEQAEKWYNDEKKSRRAMADGENPFDVYNKYGRF